MAMLLVLELGVLFSSSCGKQLHFNDTAMMALYTASSLHSFQSHCRKQSYKECPHLCLVVQIQEHLEREVSKSGAAGFKIHFLCFEYVSISISIIIVEGPLHWRER